MLENLIGKKVVVVHSELHDNSHLTINRYGVLTSVHNSIIEVEVYAQQVVVKGFGREEFAPRTLHFNTKATSFVSIEREK